MKKYKAFIGTKMELKNRADSENGTESTDKMQNINVK